MAADKPAENITQENHMKRLLTLALALMTALSLAACGGETTESETETTTKAVTTTAKAADITTTAAADETTEAVTLADTAATADNAGLPDGYKLEVYQTGEKMGIIRLTDPNLRESYPTAVSGVEERHASFSWKVELTDTYYVYLPIHNKVFDVDEVQLSSLTCRVYEKKEKTNEVSLPNFHVEGKTIVIDLDLSNAPEFSWSDVNDYKLTVFNADLDIDFAVTVPFEEATPSPFVPAETAATTAETAVTTASVDNNYFLGVDDSIVPDVLKYTVGTLTDVKYTPEGLGAYLEENVNRDLSFTFTNVTDADYITLVQHYIDGGALDSAVDDSRGRTVVTFDWGYVRVEYTSGSIAVRAFFYKTAVSATTTAVTTTTPAPNLPITGHYVALYPIYPGSVFPPDFHYIDIEQLADGRYQANIHLAWEQTDHYAVFETEDLGTAERFRLYNDGTSASDGEITITVERGQYSNKLWVTIDDISPQEFRIED
jgi:hypothetical protein